MYYYGGYSGGYNTGSCGCNNTMNYSYPSYGYGYNKCSKCDDSGELTCYKCNGSGQN